MYWGFKTKNQSEKQEDQQEHQQTPKLVIRHLFIIEFDKLKNRMEAKNLTI